MEPYGALIEPYGALWSLVEARILGFPIGNPRKPGPWPSFWLFPGVFLFFLLIEACREKLSLSWSLVKKLKGAGLNHSPEEPYKAPKALKGPLKGLVRPLRAL